MRDWFTYITYSHSGKLIFSKGKNLTLTLSLTLPEHGKHNVSKGNILPVLKVIYYNILYLTILYYTILYYTILYYTILYYTIIYYTIIYYNILYYTILYLSLTLTEQGKHNVFKSILYFFFTI